MLPEYGCAIWNMLYDPFDDITRQNIVDEVQKVIDGDPRVQANSIAVNAFDQGIRLQMDLFYVPFNAIGTFSLDFDRRTAESY
jgi:phage baseplate assembly protein W